jgi:pentatricopeptide repeat protein
LYTYNAVLKACVNSGELSQALSVFEIVKSVGLVPDKVMHTTLIHGCIEAGEFERAWNIFSGLRIEGILKPDQITYGTMIELCAQVC